MDNLFWLGRYVERSENLVRVLRTVVHRLGDDAATTRRTAASELARRLLLPQGQASAVAIASSDHWASSPSSHSTSTASRPRNAAQVFVAMTAMPLGTSTASTTGSPTASWAGRA